MNLVASLIENGKLIIENTPSNELYKFNDCIHKKPKGKNSLNLICKVDKNLCFYDLEKDMNIYNENDYFFITMRDGAINFNEIYIFGDMFMTLDKPKKIKNYFNVNKTTNHPKISAFQKNIDDVFINKIYNLIEDENKEEIEEVIEEETKKKKKKKSTKVKVDSIYIHFIFDDGYKWFEDLSVLDVINTLYIKDHVIENKKVTDDSRFTFTKNRFSFFSYNNYQSLSKSGENNDVALFTLDEIKYLMYGSSLFKPIYSNKFKVYFIPTMINGDNATKYDALIDFYNGIVDNKYFNTKINYAIDTMNTMQKEISQVIIQYATPVPVDVDENDEDKLEEIEVIKKNFDDCLGFVEKCENIVSYCVIISNQFIKTEQQLLNVSSISKFVFKEVQNKLEDTKKQVNIYFRNEQKNINYFLSYNDIICSKILGYKWDHFSEKKMYFIRNYITNTIINDPLLDSNFYKIIKKTYYKENKLFDSGYFSIRSYLICKNMIDSNYIQNLQSNSDFLIGVCISKLFSFVDSKGICLGKQTNNINREYLNNEFQQFLNTQSYSNENVYKIVENILKKCKRNNYEINYNALLKLLQLLQTNNITDSIKLYLGFIYSNNKFFKLDYNNISSDNLTDLNIKLGMDVGLYSNINNRPNLKNIVSCFSSLTFDSQNNVKDFIDSINKGCSINRYFKIKSDFTIVEKFNYYLFKIGFYLKNKFEISHE